MMAVGDGDSWAAGLQVGRAQHTYGAASGATFLAALYPHLVHDLPLCSIAVCWCNFTSPFLISNAKLSCKLHSDGLLSSLIHLASANLSRSPRFNLCSCFASYLQRSSTQIHCISRAKLSYKSLPVPLFTLGCATNG